MAPHPSVETTGVADGEDHDLFSYTIDDDLYNSIARDRAENTAAAAAGAEPNTSTNLGLDEEVKVKKARKPVPKLDEERLLSQLGIPKLRRITKEKLRFKGKGHEFSDVGRLLNLYQLWLDDLYPKAKFADGIAMVEKLGHTKRMRVMRREWIDAGKPRERREEEAVVSREEAAQKEAGMNEHANSDAGLENITRDNDDDGDDLFLKDTNIHDDFPEDDDLDMLLAEGEPSRATAESTKDQNSGKILNDDVPDDLDDLLDGPAPTTSSVVPKLQPSAKKIADDDFADEMEAMGNMNGLNDDW